MRPVFCPRCHRELEVPSMIRQPNLKVEGKIVLQCNACKKGKLVITPALRAQLLEAPIDG